MSRMNLGAVLGLCLVLTFACAKPPIGSKIDMQKLDWCTVSGLPHTCVYRNDQTPFYLTLALAKGETEGAYRAAGTCDFAKGGGQAAGHGREVVADILLIVAKHGEIVDSVSFKLEANDASPDVPFTVQFHCPHGFDAVTFYAEVTKK